MMTGLSAPRRLSLLLALALVPWTMVLGGVLTLVFPFGLVNTTPLHLTSLLDYLRFTGGFAALPGFLRAWPTSVLLYLGALASAFGGVFGHEDRRVTGGLLALTGITHLGLAVGFSRVGRLAVPVAPVLALALAWWLYWPAVRGQP
jgi:uncharacterized protein (TIGR04206 family)